MAEPEKSGRLGPAGWFAIAVLIAFLGWAGWYAFHAWNAMTGIAMGASGWIAMALGLLATLALGGGLMWLVFYSSRHDYDR